jgi:hypothetical protein
MEILLASLSQNKLAGLQSSPVAPRMDFYVEKYNLGPTTGAIIRVF